MNAILECDSITIFDCALVPDVNSSTANFVLSITVFTKDVLPGTDVGDIEYYIESIGEDQLIEDVTRIIDNYNN